VSPHFLPKRYVFIAFNDWGVIVPVEQYSAFGRKYSVFFACNAASVALNVSIVPNNSDWRAMIAAFKFAACCFAATTSGPSAQLHGGQSTITTHFQMF
jgi:hypothetical protein